MSNSIPYCTDTYNKPDNVVSRLPDKIVLCPYTEPNPVINIVIKWSIAP